MENLKPFTFLSMFTSPLASLNALKEQPRWFSPLLFSALVSAAANFYVIQRIGLVRLIEIASKSSYIIDPQAAIQNALAYRDRILLFQAASIFANIYVIALVTAGIFYLLLTIMGTDIQFKKVLAVVANANMLPIVARECMVVLTAAWVRDVNTLNIQNPLATNLAFFLRPSSSAAFRLLTSLDAISILNAVLLILGLTRVCPKLSFRAASMMVLICWSVYICATLVVPLYPS